VFNFNQTLLSRLSSLSLRWVQMVSISIIVASLVDINLTHDPYSFLLSSLPLCTHILRPDIFVNVDKFRNIRHRRPHVSTEQVAIESLPDASYSTFVTSITSSVAFFATGLIKIPALTCFAIYCGLTILMDYILSLLILYPALCINDRRRLIKSSQAPSIVDQTMDTRTMNHSGDSWIAYVLAYHYKIIHKLRWILLIASVGVISACALVAARLESPVDQDAPFLSQNNKYEMHRLWSKHLLSSRITEIEIGSFVWGLIPDDTGDYYKPDDESDLIFDTTFDPRDATTQEYLLDFCNRVYEDDDIQLKRPPQYTCVMKSFEVWLQENSQSQRQLYIDNCHEADKIPVSSDVFDSCIIAYSEATLFPYIMHENGTVKALAVHGAFDHQDKDWTTRLNAWVGNEKQAAPEQANEFFFASFSRWTNDTYNNAKAAAYTSALVSVALAFTMILLTSQSIVIALFSAISITYVLVSSTACLVILGWKLGMYVFSFVALFLPS